MQVVRDLGNIPISIGTSLAIERAIYGVGEEEEIRMENMKVSKDFLQFSPQELWINLRTLIRNLESSADPTVRDFLMTADVVADLKDEIETIRYLVEASPELNVKVKIYVATHNSIGKVFPRANHKQVKTDKALKYQELQDAVIQEFIDTYEDLNVFDVLLEGDDTQAIIMTHTPVDLLSRNRFSDLHLLESHTGKIKKRNEWNTKLTGGNKLTNIPFNAATLQVFGDKNNQFSPYPIGVKRTILKTAETFRWHSLTTDAKLIFSLDSQPDKLLADLVKELLKVRLR